jgi:hypothetical protein
MAFAGGTIVSKLLQHTNSWSESQGCAPQVKEGILSA